MSFAPDTEGSNFQSSKDWTADATKQSDDDPSILRFVV